MKDANEGDIQLVDGWSSNEGRVEILHEGQWGTVCDDNWDSRDARVVCRQRGYSGDVGRAMPGATYGRGSGPIHLTSMHCLGQEARLADCRYISWGDNSCSHSEDAGVKCY